MSYIMLKLCMCTLAIAGTCVEAASSHKRQAPGNMQMIVQLYPETTMETRENHMQMLDRMTTEENRPELFMIGEFIGYYMSAMTQSEMDTIQTMPEVMLMEEPVEMVALRNQCQEQPLTVDGEGARPFFNLETVSKRSPMEFNNSYRFPVADDGDTGVDLYIIDTGIDITHTNFENRAVFGFDATNEPEILNGHGTNVAGFAMAATYGTSKQSNAIAVKALAGVDGTGNSAITIRALQFVAGARNESRQTVINMSLGGGRSQALNNAVNAAARAGMHVVVAAGNSNEDACQTSPASAELAITVGASNVRNERSSFSNFGECVDLFAPGESIISTAPNELIIRGSGTSYASPMVAGILVNLLSSNPDMTPAEAQQRLIDDSTMDLLAEPLPEGTANRVVFQNCDALVLATATPVPSASNSPTPSPTTSPSQTPTRTPTPTPTPTTTPTMTTTTTEEATETEMEEVTPTPSASASPSASPAPFEFPGENDVPYEFPGENDAPYEFPGEENDDQRDPYRNGNRWGGKYKWGGHNEYRYKYNNCNNNGWYNNNNNDNNNNGGFPGEIDDGFPGENNNRYPGKSGNENNDNVGFPGENGDGFPGEDVNSGPGNDSGGNNGNNGGNSGQFPGNNDNVFPGENTDGFPGEGNSGNGEYPTDGNYGMNYNNMDKYDSAKDAYSGETNNMENLDSNREWNDQNNSLSIASTVSNPDADNADVMTGRTNQNAQANEAAAVDESVDDMTESSEGDLDTEEEAKEDDNNTALMIGTSAGVAAVGVLGLGAISVYFYRRRKSTQRNKELEALEADAYLDPRIEQI